MNKERCNLRGELQESHFDYDPEGLYASVEAHESISLLVSIDPSWNLYMEDRGVSNDYLYGYMDNKIFMKQPTDSSGIEIIQASCSYSGNQSMVQGRLERYGEHCYTDPLHIGAFSHQL